MPNTSTPTASTRPAPWAVQIDWLVVLLALLAAALVAGVMWVRAQYPSAGFLAEPAAQGWRIKSINRDAAQQGVPAAWLGRQITQACQVQAPERCVRLQPEWMIDSPIGLPSASAISHFIASQQSLLALASQPGDQVILYAQDANGQSASATVTLRASREFISERFALILLAAVMLYTVGCAMLAFVRRTREVWLAFGMCAGFFLFMVMRSWYTNRTWAQPEGTWWPVIELFRLGVLTCGIASVMTIWNLRLSGVKTWLPLGICAVLSSILLLHAVGVIDSSFWGYRVVTLLYLFVILGAGFAAWWQARGAGEGELLRSKTFGRIIFIGFLPLMVTMPLWTFRPDLEQIAFLQNMAVGLSAIPVVIAVSQSAQYQMHAFW
jgi:hypothetical protein